MASELKRFKRLMRLGGLTKEAQARYKEVQEKIAANPSILGDYFTTARIRVSDGKITNVKADKIHLHNPHGNTNPMPSLYQWRKARSGVIVKRKYYNQFDKE